MNNTRDPTYANNTGRLFVTNCTTCKHECVNIAWTYYKGKPYCIKCYHRAKGTLHIFNQKNAIKWTRYPNGEGEWTFTKNAEYILRAIKQGTTTIGQYTYTLSGDGKFIGRKRN